MNILITGSNGLIGSTLYDKLKLFHNVYGIDKPYGLQISDINKYDFNQNIIRVLEKLDEKKIEEKLEYVSFYCGHIDTYKGRTSVAKVLTNWIGGEE